MVAFGTLWPDFGRLLVAFGTLWVDFGRLVVAFGTLWADFGRLLVDFGGSLVAFGDPLAVFGSPLGILWAPLGTLWPPVGKRWAGVGSTRFHLDAKMVQNGARNSTKTRSGKTLKNDHCFSKTLPYKSNLPSFLKMKKHQISMVFPI